MKPKNLFDINLTIIFCIIFFIPFIINYMLQIDLNADIVGDSRDWLMFWGSYISGVAAFLVILQTHHIQKDMKQQQIMLIRKNEQERKVENLKKTLIDYYKLTSIDRLESIRDNVCNKRYSEARIEVSYIKRDFENNEIIFNMTVGRFNNNENLKLTIKLLNLLVNDYLLICEKIRALSHLIERISIYNDSFEDIIKGLKKANYRVQSEKRKKEWELFYNSVTKIYKKEKIVGLYKLIGDIIYSDNLYKLRNDYMNCMQLSIIKEENKLSKM